MRSLYTIDACSLNRGTAFQFQAFKLSFRSSSRHNRRVFWYRSDFSAGIAPSAGSDRKYIDAFNLTFPTTSIDVNWVLSGALESISLRYTLGKDSGSDTLRCEMPTGKTYLWLIGGGSMCL